MSVCCSKNLVLLKRLFTLDKLEDFALVIPQMRPKTKAYREKLKGWRNIRRVQISISWNIPDWDNCTGNTFIKKSFVDNR